MHAQPGIFAVGTTDHCYLEFDISSRDAVSVLASLPAQLHSTAGVNVVVGVRPSLWASVAPAEHVPADVSDWTEPIVGPDGFTMPATQHDLWVWVAGDRSAVFDASRDVIAALDSHASLTGETTGWVYRHDRDLTGFIDGTENPTAAEAPSIALVPAGQPGEGSSVVLHQLWGHDSDLWNAATVDQQEKAMGRTKDDSTELAEDVMPADSHVSRTTVDVDGGELDIYRRNVAWGGVGDHGTVFVGFSHDQWRMAEMLRRMAGVGDGIRCALTRYVTPTSGAYYVVPSLDALVQLAPAD